MFLKNRTAIVTGATRGIGRAIALNLAREGANIVFNYNKNKELAKSLENKIKDLGSLALSFQLDINDFGQVSKMREDVVKKFGSFDILINNAGITKDASLVMMRPEDWKDVVGTNLTGTFNMTKACIATFMKQKKGNIVNISSISGLIGTSRQANYAASKGGINAFTKSLAREVAPYNIKVNAVAPGYIDTDMTEELNDEFKEKAFKQIPLGRLGKPEEVAGVVSFLLSGHARYITGQILVVDGGLAI